jgi:hypothetical protein
MEVNRRGNWRRNLLYRIKLRLELNLDPHPEIEVNWRFYRRRLSLQHVILLLENEYDYESR